MNLLKSLKFTLLVLFTFLLVYLTAYSSSLLGGLLQTLVNEYLLCIKYFSGHSVYVTEHKRQKSLLSWNRHSRGGTQTISNKLRR